MIYCENIPVIVSNYGRAGPWPRISIYLKATPFEVSSKRRRGFASETRVKRGHRIVHGNKELF